MRFTGTESYVATEDLKVAVNAAIVLERPLLVKGEPGTGKTVLAEEIARALGAPLMTWHVKSTTKAHQGLYEYDAVSRLRDSQLGDPRVSDVRNYIRRGKLWEAFAAEARRCSSSTRSTRPTSSSRTTSARARPHGVPRLRDRARPSGRAAAHRDHHLEQREGAAGRLPAPLLLPLHPLPRSRDHGPHRRGALPRHQAPLVEEALRIFFEVREVPGLKKKPSTSELLDWLKLLLSEDIGPSSCASATPASSSRRCTGACSRTSRT
jgi:MoxR-like ATPase